MLLHLTLLLLLHDGNTVFTELRLMNKAGEWVWMQANSFNMLHDPYIKGIITNFRDISEKKLAEEKLRHYAQDLERSNRELENFAYIASHDLQEPLRKIRTFGERLRARDGDGLSERGDDYLDRIQNAASRLQVLIDDLLRFSRITTQAQAFEKVSLDQVLKEVLNDLELMIERTQAQVSVGPLPSLEAEPTLMRQLFQNLITNAIKFSKEGGRPQVQIYARPADPLFPEMIQVVVEDQGIGFSSQYAEKIFQLFQRLEGRRREGSGIGLAVWKKIVRCREKNLARKKLKRKKVIVVTF